jgi:hypothetical protein
VFDPFLPCLRRGREGGEGGREGFLSKFCLCFFYSQHIHSPFLLLRSLADATRRCFSFGRAQDRRGGRARSEELGLKRSTQASSSTQAHTVNMYIQAAMASSRRLFRLLVLAFTHHALPCPFPLQNTGPGARERAAAASSGRQRSAALALVFPHRPPPPPDSSLLTHTPTPTPRNSSSIKSRQHFAAAAPAGREKRHRTLGRRRAALIIY